MERFCSPMDMEPRTLSPGELNIAREAAVDIVQKEVDEASNVFTKGLRPVMTIKRIEMQVEKRNQLHRLVVVKDSSEALNMSWDSACTSNTLEESPDNAKIVEPLSAPF